MDGKRRSGVTLVELLVILIVISALTVIAMPRFGGTKARTYRATMQADLRNLATAQEAYLVDWNTYYGGPLPNWTEIKFKPSDGVTVDMVTIVVGGWGATSTHSSIPTTTCAIYVGTSPPVAPAANEGEIACQ